MKIVQITVNFSTNQVFGLGDDNKLYYWNTYLAEPEWTIYTQ